MEDKGYLLEDFESVFIRRGMRAFLESQKAVIGYGTFNEDGASFQTREQRFELLFEPAKNRLFLSSGDDKIPVDATRYPVLLSVFGVYGPRLERMDLVAKEQGKEIPEGLRINSGIEKILDAISHSEL